MSTRHPVGLPNTDGWLCLRGRELIACGDTFRTAVETAQHIVAKLGCRPETVGTVHTRAASPQEMKAARALIGEHPRQRYPLLLAREPLNAGPGTPHSADVYRIGTKCDDCAGKPRAGRRAKCRTCRGRGFVGRLADAEPDHDVSLLVGVLWDPGKDPDDPDGHGEPAWPPCPDCGSTNLRGSDGQEPEEEPLECARCTAIFRLKHRR